jgi:hypothetical protein
MTRRIVLNTVMNCFNGETTIGSMTWWRRGREWKWTRRVVDLGCLRYPWTRSTLTPTLSRHSFVHPPSRVQDDVDSLESHGRTCTDERRARLVFPPGIISGERLRGSCGALHIKLPTQPVFEQLTHSTHHVYSTRNPAVFTSDPPETKPATTMLPYSTPSHPRNLVTTPPSLSRRRPACRPRRIAWQP